MWASHVDQSETQTSRDAEFFLPLSLFGVPVINVVIRIYLRSGPRLPSTSNDPAVRKVARRLVGTWEIRQIFVRTMYSSTWRDSNLTPAASRSSPQFQNVVQGMRARSRMCLLIEFVGMGRSARLRVVNGLHSASPRLPHPVSMHLDMRQLMLSFRATEIGFYEREFSVSWRTCSIKR